MEISQEVKDAAQNGTLLWPHVGNCPVCGDAGNLGYNHGEEDLEDGVYIYPWTCGNCGSTGNKTYKMVYAGHKITELGECPTE